MALRSVEYCSRMVYCISLGTLRKRTAVLVFFHILPGHFCYDRYSLSSRYYERHTHISCLLLPARYCYDRYSLSSKYYEPHAFYRKHFWCFSTFRTKNIHILSVAGRALLLRSILIPFEFVTNRTLFIETITCDFPHLERRIYTYILSVAASALLL